MKKQYTVREFGQHNDRVVFFFAGMGTRTWLYKRPITFLVSKGFRVVAYDFDAMIVRRGNVDNLLLVADEVLQSVKDYVAQFRKQGISYFATFGASMGTLPAIACAAEIPEVSKVVINMTYGSVAENVWTWWFIKPAKQRAIKQGYTLESLDKKLAPMTPIYNAEKLKGKQVLLYLSTKDKVLLFEQSRQFKEVLDKHGIDYQYVQNDQHGHLVTGYINFKKREIYLEFLNDST